MKPVPRNGSFAEYCKYYVNKNMLEYAANGCWNWKGRITDKGYAQVSNGKGRNSNGMTLGLRVFYEQKYGPIEENKEPHHTCRNRRCVNPEHAEIVTHQKNCELDALMRVPQPLYEKTRRKRA